MGNKVFNVNCFASKEVARGVLKCTALQDANCLGCKFFKTQEDYDKNVKPLKHKNV